MFRSKGSQEKSTAQYRYHAVPTSNNPNPSSSNNLEDPHSSPPRLRGQYPAATKANDSSLLGSNVNTSKSKSTISNQTAKALKNINTVGKSASVAASTISDAIRNINPEMFTKKGKNGKYHNKFQYCMEIFGLILLMFILFFCNRYLIHAIGLIFCQFTVGIGGNIMVYHDPYIEPNIAVYQCSLHLHTYLYSKRQTDAQIQIENNNNNNNNNNDKIINLDINGIQNIENRPINNNNNNNNQKKIENTSNNKHKRSRRSLQRRLPISKESELESEAEWQRNLGESDKILNGKIGSIEEKRFINNDDIDFINKRDQCLSQRRELSISKIIHQTYISWDTLPERWKLSPKLWKYYHPDWEYKFWDDEALYQFIKNNYAWFLPFYTSLSQNKYLFFFAIFARCNF